MKKNMYSFAILCLLFAAIPGIWNSGLSCNFSIIDNKLFVFSSRFNNRLFYHVDTRGDKLVALTFDDGPDPVYTPRALDILDQHQIKATFFVVGEQAEYYPDLLLQAVERGHEIENHTFTHPDLTRESYNQVVLEILKTQQVIENITKRSPVYFRPPKRLTNRQVTEMVEQQGLKTVLWTVGVESQESPTVQNMAERVINHARPGCIILAHDGRLDRSRTLEALPLIIEGYQQMGYRFVTLEELMQHQHEPEYTMVESII
ncbi:polysaccharide deacetylase family protein [hydrocarbon metagenome]|uniref:Polysaccharide deacetylase family protein n=1 Tax=hydrocarbon metagenome TaxID=938273 RepID=A0A0W8E423_9ZZZZ